MMTMTAATERTPRSIYRSIKSASDAFENKTLSWDDFQKQSKVFWKEALDHSSGRGIERVNALFKGGFSREWWEKNL
jgi:hypothetical protein